MKVSWWSWLLSAAVGCTMAAASMYYLTRPRFVIPDKCILMEVTDRGGEVISLKFVCPRFDYRTVDTKPSKE